MKPLTFYADPSHGWLAVPYKMLVDLGIEHNISSCSYRGKRLAYLEEDCDAGVFVKAFKAKHGFKPPVEFKHTNSRSHVRSMPSYWSDEVVAPDLLATLQGILNYIEDGSVVEVRPCGFTQEIHNAIAIAKGGEV